MKKKKKWREILREHEHEYSTGERDLLAMIMIMIIMTIYVKPLIAFITKAKGEQWILVMVQRIEKTITTSTIKNILLVYIFEKKKKNIQHNNNNNNNMKLEAI